MSEIKTHELRCIDCRNQMCRSPIVRPCRMNIGTEKNAGGIGMENPRDRVVRTEC